MCRYYKDLLHCRKEAILNGVKDTVLTPLIEYAICIIKLWIPHLINEPGNAFASYGSKPKAATELPDKLGHYSDAIMSAIASQITSVTIVYSTVYSRRRSKKTSMLRVTGLCAGNSPVTGEFPTQRASNAENISIWWRNNACLRSFSCYHRYHVTFV